MDRLLKAGETAKNTRKQRMTMTAIRRFGYGSALRVPSTAMRGGRLYVGEAAGFQDSLFAFGMRYAMLSGLLAARALSEGEDYDRLWREAFGHKLAVGRGTAVCIPSSAIRATRR